MTGPRYPWQALRVAAGAPSDTALGRRVGVSGTDLKRYRDTGLPEQVAEKYAVRLGLQPFEVWPEMVDDRLAELEADRRRRKAEAQRRWRSKPEVRERVRAQRRAYYAEAGAYEREQERRRYWADPERQRERKRRERNERTSAA